MSARRYVASTRTESTLPARRIARGLEALLPHDVGVLRVVDAGAEFHALRDATWKWYRYGLVIARGRRPLDEPRAWRRGRVPELAALQAAARALVGRHDFASFCNAGSPRASTVRTLLGARWTRRGRRLTFDVVGDGFLYKMVRTLVGTQLRAAGGLDPIGDVLAVLAACDRRRAGASAPAHGLTLLDVGFGERPPAWCAGEAGVD